MVLLEFVWVLRQLTINKHMAHPEHREFHIDIKIKKINVHIVLYIFFKKPIKWMLNNLICITITKLLYYVIL